MQHKNKLVALILCIGLLASVVFMGASANTGVFAPHDPRNEIIDAGVLLYMGYGGYGTGNKYTRFTDSELDQLVEVSEDFVLLTIPNYNWYYDTNGVRQSILDFDDIRNIRPTRDGNTWANGGADTSIPCECPGSGPDWDRMFAHGFNSVPDPGQFDCTFLFQMWSYARNMNWMLNTPTMTLESLVADYLDVAVRLADRNPDVRLWLSFPATENMHILTYRFTPYWIEHIIYGSRDALYAMGREDVWHNNVVGFYYGNEEIVPWFTPMNRDAHNNPDADYLENSVVKGMRELADVVRDELGMKFLWIPTVNIEGSSLEVVGLITNRLNIFDAVVLQPNYYFRENPGNVQDRTRRQVWAIRDWIIEGAITDPGTMDGDWEYIPGDGAYVTQRVWNPDLGRYVPVMIWNPDFAELAWSYDGGYDWNAIIWNERWSQTGGWCVVTWENTGVWTQVTWPTWVIDNPSDFWNPAGGVVWTVVGRYEQEMIWDPDIGGGLEWSADGGYDTYAMEQYIAWGSTDGWCLDTWLFTGEWVWVTNGWLVLTRDPQEFWNPAGGLVWVTGTWVPQFVWDDNAGDWEWVTVWDPNAGGEWVWVPGAAGSPFGGEKTSFTQIGFHMEIEETIFSGGGFRDRWFTYVAAFEDLLGLVPSAVYAGHPRELMATLDYINDFFNVDRLNATESDPVSDPISDPVSDPISDPISLPTESDPISDPVSDPLSSPESLPVESEPTTSAPTASAPATSSPESGNDPASSGGQGTTSAPAGGGPGGGKNADTGVTAPIAAIVALASFGMAALVAVKAKKKA